MKNLLITLILSLTFISCNQGTKGQVEKSSLKDETENPERPEVKITSAVDTLEKEVKKEELTATERKLIDLRTENTEKHLLIVSEPCAIIFLPNRERIKKLQKEMSGEDYAIVVDDNMYYLAVTRIFLVFCKRLIVGSGLLFKQVVGENTQQRLIGNPTFLTL